MKKPFKFSENPVCESKVIGDAIRPFYHEKYNYTVDFKIRFLITNRGFYFLKSF